MKPKYFLYPTLFYLFYLIILLIIGRVFDSVEVFRLLLSINRYLIDIVVISLNIYFIWKIFLEKHQGWKRISVASGIVSGIILTTIFLIFADKPTLTHFLLFPIGSIFGFGLVELIHWIVRGFNK